MVAALSIPENHRTGWKNLKLWAGFAVVAALVVLVPLIRDSFKMSQTRAWQVAAGGFAALCFFWVLFVLPSISQNTSFLATVSVVAAGLAVWLTPGRPDSASGGSGSSTGQTW